MSNKFCVNTCALKLMAKELMITLLQIFSIIVAVFLVSFLIGHLLGMCFDMGYDSGMTGVVEKIGGGFIVGVAGTLLGIVIFSADMARETWIAVKQWYWDSVRRCDEKRRKK